MTQFYQPSLDDPNVDPPRPGSHKMALFLTRNPRQIDLVNTSDGAPAAFPDDGGKIENGHMAKPSANRQLIMRCCRRVREDKGFEGLPLFISFKEILPAFQGDLLTTNKGGMIVLGTEAHRKMIKASLEVRNKRIAEARVHGAKEFEKLKLDTRDPVVRLAEMLEKAIGPKATLTDDSVMVALQAQVAALQAENESLKVVPANAGTDEKPKTDIALEAPKSDKGKGKGK